MPRLTHWEQKFVEFMEAATERPFSWGEHDCAIFAGRSVEAITGTNPLADYVNEAGQGRYKTAKSAYRLLYKLDDGSLAVAAARQLGEEINPMFAQRGDVVLQNVKDDAFFTERLGVCVGSEAAFAHEPKGLSYVHMKFCAKAWRVS